MAEDERFSPPVVGAGGKIAASEKTIVREQDDTKVIKEDLQIYQLQRKSGESAEEYRQRRLEKCFEFIKKQLGSETRARQILPQQINAPQEFHFIAVGKDGFPTPFRAQEKILGQALKQTDLASLTPERQNDLDNLLRASLAGYREHGHFLDLVGRVAEEPKSPLMDMKRFWSPLANSNNIMISPDGSISLVDVRLSRKAPLKDAVKFFLIFSYLYRKRLGKLEKKTP